VDNLEQECSEVLTGYPQAVTHVLTSFKTETDRAERVVHESVKRAAGEPLTAPFVKKIKRELYPPIPDSGDDLKVAPGSPPSDIPTTARHWPRIVASFHTRLIQQTPWRQSSRGKKILKKSYLTYLHVCIAWYTLKA